MVGVMDATWQVLHEFIRWQKLRNLSPRTTTKYRDTLRGYLESLDGAGVGGATKDDVERFLSMRRLHERARYSYLSQISNFYQWAIDEGLASEDPTRRIPRPQIPETLPRPIAGNDLRLALTAAGPRMRAWLCLGAYAGLRCKEMAGVRAEDLHWNRDPAVLVVSAPKGKRQRVVPINAKVDSALHLHGLPRRGYVFTGNGDSTRPLLAETVSKTINTFLRELGIDATAHQLRHHFGTAVYALSKDIRLTQELLGHRDPGTTTIYTKLSPVEAAEVVQKL